MRTLYSTQFGFADPSDASAHVIYTVPPGYRAVLRDLDAVFGITGGSIVFIQLAGDSVAMWTYASTVVSSAQWRGRQVLNAGQTIAVIAPGLTAGNYHVMASGYLLELP